MSKAEKAVEGSNRVVSFAAVFRVATQRSSPYYQADDIEDFLRQRQRNDATSNGNAKARGKAIEGDFRAQLSALSLANLVF